jgi:NAD(P)-dependent dehydrogenase (short-subunit alcohol dehydrogenase family)
MKASKNLNRRQILTTAAVVAAGQALPSGPALAGGHNRAPASKEPIKIDTAPKPDLTGTVLITGSNRGIGLELARNYAARGWQVIATARKPDKADELQSLAADNPKVAIEQLDVLNAEMIDALAARLADQPIDVLLNNAAVLGEPNEQNFGDFNFDTLAWVMATNVAGPMRIAEAFIGSVEKSEQKKIVAITSAQGSISQLRSPSIVFYNMSKAALNMGMKSNSRALKKRGVTVALISPGAVETDMMNLALERAGVTFKLLTPAQSAEMVINVIDNYGIDLTGTFLSHKGEQIPW